MWAAILSMVVAQAAPDDGDRPFVEILESTGAVDGPAEAGTGVPRWERVRMELSVANRLSVDVSDLDLMVALVSAGSAEDDARGVIPGWSFRQELDVIVPASDQTYVRIERELPSRRTSPPADEIAYRVRITSYRMNPPDLATALRLLGSSRRSDQRAALESYDASFPPPERDRLGQELAIALASLPSPPKAKDALRLLFAIRALGSLRAPRHVADLLHLPERLDREAWGRAVLDLAERIIDASASDEPRLFVLPTWARSKSAFLRVRAEDALEDAVRDAILRMGDSAVPALLLQTHEASQPAVRSRAKRLLHTMGRSTVRSQLALRDREARLAVIAVLGQISSAEPVPALVELMMTGRDRGLTEATQSALESIGPPAIEALVDALGAPRDAPVKQTLVRMSAKHPRAIREVAARYGVTARSEPERVLVERLRHHLKTERQSRLVAEVEIALEDGRQGRFAESFDRLDRVFLADEKLYMRYAEPIAAQYLESARKLYAHGNYDAAVDTLKAGLSVRRTPEAEALLDRTRLALVRGYIDLGDLPTAVDTLELVRANAPERRDVEGNLLAARAFDALDRGDTQRARALLDRARRIHPDDPRLQMSDRRLMLSENLTVIIALALLIPALGLAMVLSVRRRFESARMRRIALRIDKED